MTTRPVVAVFAGSSTPKDPVILDAAVKLGKKLAEAGYDIIYGGGDRGVMGAVAQAARDAGANITAVVVQKYAHENQIAGARIVPVATENERFDVMSNLGNPVAFFTLPGGPGALREAIQGLEKAVYENGPNVILVQAGAYLDGIKQYFDLAVTAGLINESKKDSIKVWAPDDDITTVLPPRGGTGGIPGLYQGLGR